MLLLLRFLTPNAKKISTPLRPKLDIARLYDSIMKKFFLKSYFVLCVSNLYRFPLVIVDKFNLSTSHPRECDGWNIYAFISLYIYI